MPRHTALLGALVLALVAPAETASGQDRPNIVLIVTDDMGYSDMGSFGSEIKTPHFDALADDGVRFTQFYTHASCSPTRSMLLSGVDTHLNGLGNMNEWTAPNQAGEAGYEGVLNDQVATLPQLLLDSGYHTYMVGKWHLGKAPDRIPRARGFERDFSLLDGGGSYWDMTNLTALSPRSVFTEDGRYLTALPDDYYATKTYTDKMIEFIDSDRGDGQPFFAYVAHQAPHDPYHLPRDWRDRHVGEYDGGWDGVRRARLQRQLDLGIVPDEIPLAERMWFVPPPITLAPAPRAVLGRKMELYAGMMENLDFHVGRLVDHLKDTGEYENTIFYRVRRQRGRRHRPLSDACRHTRHTQLSLRGRQLVADTPEGVGRPWLLRRLRPDVGASLDDALQSVQGMAGGGRDHAWPSGSILRARSRPPAIRGRNASAPRESWTQRLQKITSPGRKPSASREAGNERRSGGRLRRRNPKRPHRLSEPSENMVRSAQRHPALLYQHQFIPPPDVP